MNRNKKRSTPALLALAVVAGLVGCTSDVEPPVEPEAELYEVAASERQWTGVTVSKQGRIFVNYPRWSMPVPFAVGEVMDDGTVTPYPNETINTWDSTFPAGERFVCVQSVYVCENDYLWILDPASPGFQGTVEGGPKLVKIDLGKDSVVHMYHFDSTVAPANSYLNDVRIDINTGTIYITDSGTGAIITLDLATGKMRRLLADHPSTKSEGIAVVINEAEWRRPDGGLPDVHADGIALDSAGEYLYYHALTADTLYRIATRYLRDTTMSETELGQKVETLASTGPVDGIIIGPLGDVYLSALEEHSIKRYTIDGTVETVVQDDRLKWPDTFALGPDNYIYVTTSQIHLMPSPEGPFRLLKFKSSD